MINEIFRFAVVRAPKLEPSQTDRIIRVIEWMKEDTPYYEHLKAQVQANEHRLAIAEAAQSYLNEQGINLEFLGFQWPIIPFAKWLFAQDAELSATIVLSQVNSIFGTGIHELLKDPTFQADQQKLASGLIAASTLLSGMEPLRSRLIQGLKAVKLLMAISREEVTGKRAIREILDYAVLLPGDVFPLPDPQAQRKAQLEEEREKQQAAFLKQTARVAALLETYAKQQTAIEELIQSYHKMRQFQSAENLNLPAQTVQTQPVQTVRIYDGLIQKAVKFLGIAPVQKWKTPPASGSLQVLAPKDILGTSYIEQLSASTQGVLQQLETTGEGVDVPVVITQLQAANAQIAAELGNFNTVLPGIPLPPDLITEAHDFVSGVLGACAPTSTPDAQQEQQAYVPDT
ncbi:MAG: hypothetical protein KDC44_25255, partial [Phaeodactylibacter sp.]|nr:hypothetical protein [Phaeodactylibacter sp.]